jgi:death-on-curing protein
VTVFVTLEDLLDRIARTGGVVRDLGLLEAAVARPQASAFGEDAYPSLAHKAAALLHSIAQYQALLDGNKRLALGSALLMLRLNGARSAATHDDLFDLMIDMADGLDDIDSIADRLRVVHLPSSD